MKRRPSDWLKIVKLYVDDGVPMSKLAKTLIKLLKNA